MNKSTPHMVKKKSSLHVINPIYDYLMSSIVFKTWAKYSSLVVKYEEETVKSPRRRISFKDVILHINKNFEKDDE